MIWSTFVCVDGDVASACTQSRFAAARSSRCLLNICRLHALVLDICGSDASAATEAQGVLQRWLDTPRLCKLSGPATAGDSRREEAARASFVAAVTKRRRALELQQPAVDTLLAGGACSGGSSVGAAYRSLEFAVLSSALCALEDEVGDTERCAKRRRLAKTRKGREH